MACPMCNKGGFSSEKAIRLHCGHAHGKGSYDSAKLGKELTQALEQNAGLTQAVPPALPASQLAKDMLIWHLDAVRRLIMEL